ncbi:MAG TPA: hypothetical protein VKK31_11000 [Thermoanaerobaculia bacterium]|nr:hypothetical protein [Thermoanaerobaculia bacterium]
MTDETLPPGLWQETRRAAEAWEQARGPRGDEPGPGPIGAGQVLVLPELGEPRLAWAVLRREAGENGRRLLVVADVNPLVGSGDVAVTAPVTGSLTLRCRFAVWVNQWEIGAATLLATLPPEALAQADSRWRALAAGGPAGTFTEQETEEDPEYRDWIEDVVRPAVGKLAARAGVDTPNPPSVLPFPTPPPNEPLPSRQRAWMRWAAVFAFLVLGAGSGTLWWRQGQEIAGLRAAKEASESAHRQAITELESRRAGLEAQYQKQLQAAGEDRARLEAEHRERLGEIEAKLEKLRQSTEIKNPMIITSLETAAALRGPTRIEIGPEVSHLVLLLSVDDPAGTEFQVEVSERSSGQRILVQNGIRADVLGEVHLGLPTALLPPGDYRLCLFRVEGGKLHLVREHVVDIDEEPRRRPSRL